MQNCADHRRYAAGCEACRRQAREYMRASRARHRGIELEPELEPPAFTVVEPAPEQTPAPPLEHVPGRVEAAVAADLDTLGVPAGSNALAAAALVLARDLDDRRLATSHASMARVLGQLMATLRREAAPKRGRLAAVQDMSTRA
jgi:hypothetical protein